MIWLLLGILAGAYMLWRRRRSGGDTDEAQRQLMSLLADQAADDDQVADKEISDNLDI